MTGPVRSYGRARDHLPRLSDCSRVIVLSQVRGDGSARQLPALEPAEALGLSDDPEQDVPIGSRNHGVLQDDVFERHCCIERKPDTSSAFTDVLLVDKYLAMVYFASEN